MRLTPLFSALLIVATCTGCNARPASSPTASGESIVVAQLPGGGDCRSVIARYRAVTESDVQTGNANKSVGAQIEREIGGADAACAAGREGEALRLIASSKSRHGYPGGN